MAATAFSSPRRRKTTAPLAAIWTPAPISFNSFACSRTVTSMPCSRIASAAPKPPIPPPTTMTFISICLQSSESGAPEETPKPIIKRLVLVKTTRLFTHVNSKIQ